MRCDRAQAAISEQMDGEHLRAVLVREVESHVAECPACASFSERAARVRTLVRIAPAEPVPDLVEPIMTAVAGESRARGREKQTSAPGTGRLRFRSRTREGRDARRRLAPAAVALALGLVVGSVLVGGPWPRGDHPPTALALPRRVLAGAASIHGVRAAFTMTERDFVAGTNGPRIPERSFRLRVWYRAPERFRMQVRDLSPRTSSGTVAPNDLTYIVNRDRSFLRAPSACPPRLGAACPERRTVVTHTHRPPFSSRTPMPADLVLPVNVFASLDHGIPELGRTRILGQEAIHVELPYAQAAPLFSFLDVGGQWRPFFRQDRVELWLDADTWFPLRAQISATPSAARRRWEPRFSLSPEYGRTPLLRLSATSYRDLPPPNGVFSVPSSGRLHSEDARSVPIGSLPELPFAPRALGDAEGLHPYRAVETSTPAGRQIAVAYAAGLTWLRVTTAPPRSGSAPPGAELVRLANGGSGYLRPDPDQLGHTLLVHTPGADLVLDTDLPPGVLLHIAAELPVLGQPLPTGTAP